MQIGDWGNALICHVRERKHWKYSPWACPFSGDKFCGAFHFQKIIFLQLLQIWSSYCFHCDTDQLWTNYERTHKATTRQSVSNGFYWQSKIWPCIWLVFSINWSQMFALYVRCVGNSNWKFWTTEKQQHRFGITRNVTCIPIHAFALHSNTRFFSEKFCTKSEEYFPNRLILL